MDLLWPGFLVLMGLIPLLIAAYVWVWRRRRRFAVRYSSLSLVREALPHQSRLKRFLPLALFLAAIASLIVALTRPVSIVSVPTDQTTVVLVIDVSRSMCSSDIQPTRLGAAEEAALSFIKGQKSSTQIAIVAFSTFAALVQPPTRNEATLEAAVDSLTIGSRTAIGSAILKALDAISEVDKNVAPSVNDLSSGAEPTPVPKGAYAPDIIVLLTDGVSNTGPAPLEAAQQAADRGVRVYTIGFGTANGTEFAHCDQQYLGNGSFLGGGGRAYGNGSRGGGGRGFGFGGFDRGIDEATLKQIADMTGGQYYSAQSANQLQNVFHSLPMYLITKHETTEISFMFVAAGALLAGLALILSMMWHPLP